MGQEDEETMSILVTKDRCSKRLWATTVPSKAAEDFSKKFMAEAVHETGYKRVILKSDGERPIVALKRAVRDELTSVECALEEAPRGDRQANGDIEVAVREVKKQIRVVRSDLEEKFGRPLRDDDPMSAWVPTHAAFLISMFRKGDDGRTAYERLTNRTPCGGVQREGPLQAGDCRAQEERLGAEDQGPVGHHVGTRSRNAELLLKTPSGIQRGLSCTIMPESQRWNTEDYDKLKGLPWTWNPDEVEKLPSPLRIDLPVLDRPEPVEVQPRVFVARNLLRAEGRLGEVRLHPRVPGVRQPEEERCGEVAFRGMQTEGR